MANVNTDEVDSYEVFYLRAQCANLVRISCD